MAVYKLQKKSRSGRRVAVQAERIEWNIPAMIVCLLLACVIWLYIVSSSDRPQEPPTDPSPSESVAADGGFGSAIGAAL